ncbi:MAG: hypothetical protein LPK09_05075 [Hymenobacteraceae bacterium]|nr:hypothetical protein [Hymenobacteraceae bacterium]
MAIILTNLDRLTMNVIKAIILGLLLSMIMYFVVIITTIGLEPLLKEVGIVIVACFAAVLMFVINSLYFDMQRFKIGLIATALFAIPSFYLSTHLTQYFTSIVNTDGLAVNLEVFIIVWQTLVGLGISIGIWFQSPKFTNSPTNPSPKLS